MREGQPAVDHELLRSLIGKHHIGVDALAIRSGYSTQSIYGYLHDNGPNAPLAVWTALFQLTGDLLIPRMILQGTPHAVIKTAEAELMDAAGGLAKLCENQIDYNEGISNFLRVWQDGKITPDEQSGVEQFEALSMKACAGLVALMNATRDALNKALAAKRS